MVNKDGHSAHQAKFFAHALTRAGGSGVQRIQQSLLNAAVDLNPHQVEAALFALRSPLSKGALLADEVGLGKTIEAGLVLCQFWAERKRRLLVICPAALRRQWQCELEEKFNLPCQIVDAKAKRLLEKAGLANPYEKAAVLISSYSFAAREAENLKRVAWDCAVLDEAHKLRNSYRESARMGRAIRFALQGRRKLLLTATPLQNNLTELYGIATLIDESAFGDLASFRSRYVNAGGDLDGLRARLASFSWRTLRKDVMAYVKYTNRIPMMETFEASDRENDLYVDVSAYLQDETSYAFPEAQRPLLTLLVRKLLASSTAALAGTLLRIRSRLERLRDGAGDPDEDLLEVILGDDADLAAELVEEVEDDGGVGMADEVLADEPAVDPVRLAAEIARVDDFIARACAIGTDTKTRRLVVALDAGWKKLAELGAAQKAVVFTESRRTMERLREHLEAHGYAGEVVCFSGGGRRDAVAEGIYADYRAAHPEDTSAKSVMMRHALVAAFRDRAKILIATEAGAEGINLQFCSMVVNYDLPWNPQRVEQRIGRCHRYGQRHDIVVVNFCNTRNAADVRVHELLSSKLRLFEGVFGASNDVLGVVGADGVPFERRIAAILSQCRTEAEINAQFDRLQEELQDEIARRRAVAEQAVMENLDEDVRRLLKVDPVAAQNMLSESETRFLALTRVVLDGAAEFADGNRQFTLKTPPADGIAPGRYALKGEAYDASAIAYRPNTPLGEWAIARAKASDTPLAEIAFDITHHAGRISVLEALKGRRGVLCLHRLLLKSLDAEERLLFSALTDSGEVVEADVAERLFSLAQDVRTAAPLAEDERRRLFDNARQYATAETHRVGEANHAFFKEAVAKLDLWADDQVAAATLKIDVLKAQLRDVRRQKKNANTLDELASLEKKEMDVTRQIRRARQNVFAVEDEIEQKREDLIERLRRKLVPETVHEELFTIRWRVV